jgi:hypothetical protein
MIQKSGKGKGKNRGYPKKNIAPLAQNGQKSRKGKK